MFHLPTGRGPAVVTRALVASVSTVHGSVMEQMLAFRNEHCAPRSPRAARIALMHLGGWFVAWFEGSDDAVDRALLGAASDPRNVHQKLLHRSRGPATLHEPVLVATTSLPLKPSQFAQHVLQARQHPPFHGEPRALWRQLGSPVVRSDAAAARVPLRRTALVSAEEHGAIDMLRRLGDQHRSPVVYQRFGGARRHSPDVGAAYVDIPATGGIERVHFLSRRALEHPLACLALGDIDAMLFVPGAHAEMAVRTAARVGRCVQGLATQPPVHLLGAINDAARACAQVLECCGVTRVLAGTHALAAECAA